MHADTRRTIAATALSLITFLPTARAADPWSADDKQRLAIYMTLLTIDYGQTRYIAAHPDEFYETNPLLGRHPTKDEVDRYFVASALVHTAVAHFLPADNRQLFQRFFIGYQAAFVGHNYSIGIKVDF